MGEESSNSEDADYYKAFAALDELKLGKLKEFFKEKCLRDETLFLMQSEAELKEILTKELALPFGHGFAFSRQWFKKYHSNEETTPCQTVTKTDIGNTEQPLKRNAQPKIEPRQIAVPPNSGDKTYGLEASRDSIDSTKRETQVRLEDTNVLEKRKVTGTLTALPDGTDERPDDDLDSVSLTDQNHVKFGSTKEQTATSSGLSETTAGLPKKKTSTGNNNQTPKQDVKEKSLLSQIAVPAKLPEHEVDEADTSQDVTRREAKVYLNDDALGELNSTVLPMATQKQSDVNCERMKELTSADDHDSVSLSDQNCVKEDVCLKEFSLTKDQTATSSDLSETTAGLPKKKTSNRNNNQTPKRDVKEKSLLSQIAVPTKLPEHEVDDGCASQDVTREARVCVNDDVVGERNATVLPMATQKQSDVNCERMKELTSADDHDSVSLSDQNRVKEDVCLKEFSLTKDQTATSSVLSADCDERDEGSGPVARQDVTRRQVNFCLEDDGVDVQKTTEPPMTAQIPSDVRCAKIKGLDGADDLESVSVSDQNHVKEGDGLKECSSGGQLAEAKQNTGTTSTSTGREISTEDESISSDVAKTGSHCVVYNNDNNNNHEEGPSALCSEESGTPIKERSTEKTLTGNENKHASKKSISKAKGRKKKQKKASKGTKSSQTTTKAKDKEDRKEDEQMCSEGEAPMTLDNLGKAVEVEDDMSEAATLPVMDKHSILTKVKHAEVVNTDSDVSPTTKISSEKEEEDRLGGSVRIQKEPSKTETQSGPLCENVQARSLVVENDRSLIKEQKSVMKERGESADLEKGSKMVHICTPRPRGVAGRDTFYEKGSVLDAEENRELEFKSLVSAQLCSLPWKIMEKAKKFICACLNADRNGIIYFGVGDNQEQDSKYRHGEILGLEVEDIKDDINKAFQFVLDDHIKSDAGPLQKGGEQNCVNLHFVPVKYQGDRTNLYVIEIEVSRDWRFSKDNVYYSKTWAEKRVGKDCAGKKALSDYFKVKDEYDDVAVRTNGASSCVKQLEVDRQVKKPLEVKYKEWRKQVSTHGAHELPEEVSLDDADAKRFSAVLKERLHELNHKEYGYILVANKLPAKYRGTADLSFLQNIPWLAVFDLFDPASKKDGLHYACNETTDAPRAKIRTLDDFKDVAPDKDLSIRETTWILSNDEMQKGDWIKGSKDCLYRALSAYKQCFFPGHLICVFLCLSESSVQEMADIIESSFSILGNSASSCVTILSETSSVSNAFIKASKFSLQKELGECSITDIPWKLLKEIVREMVGPSNFEERGAATELPFFTGSMKKVLNKIVHSWKDLEVYSPNPRLPSLAEAIERERNAFYKGSQASQVNLSHNHSIARSLEKEIHTKVERALKLLSKENTDASCQVKTITVPYEPGSGATTLCRRILWNKRVDYRCAVVKAITSSTDYQVEKLQSIVYDERNINFSLPVLILVDNFPESDVRQLTERIIKRETKCVILTTFPIAKSATNFSFEITPLRKLDENETRLVKDILINITSDAERRREAEQVLEREKRFIWFGLELFGRDYLKIEERLQNHIRSVLIAFLGESQRIHKKLLEMCCFLSKYSDGCTILPHAVLLEFLLTRLWTQKQSSAMQDVHEIFGGLLLEEQDETNGYYGWRPAHYLVSEVVTSAISIEDTAVHFLEKVCKCQPYVVKFLRQQLFKICLDRKRISDPIFPEEQGTDDSPDGSDFDDVFGSYEVRTRYSPLIVDILHKGNIPGALRVLIAICREAVQPVDKAYAWQQLARFMGYEMLEKEMNESEDLHKSLYRAMASNKEPDIFLMPKIGIEAAHIAVDIAINHHPNYGHHYVTKGDLYRLQLRQLEERHNLPGSLPKVIEICRKALEVYDKALKTSHGFNHYPMIGKIQAILSLLNFVRSLSCFNPEDESFTRYLETYEIPQEMADELSQEEHDYVKSLSSTTLDILNELFGNVKFKQTTTYDDNEIRSLNNAKIRASKLRRAFYKITGYDRRQLGGGQSPTFLSPSTKEEPAHYQQFVEDVLFIHDETPYSAWSNLPDREVVSIYNHLKPVCLRGHGSHNDMLICSKACLQLKERPPVSELDEIVSKWVTNFPNSVWAHLFNYMVHFPIPNRSLAPYNPSTKASIKKCVSIVTEKAGTRFRKSGTEYFLGKGIGLDAILSSQEFRWLETKWKTKTHFWRSKETTEKLERVQGQKDLNFKGAITYQGIQLNFDNTLYPNESKDDLWFYVGFSVTGPYAYDPVDNDTYAQIKQQTEESALTGIAHPSSGTFNSGSKVAPIPGHPARGKPRFVNSYKDVEHPVTKMKPPNVSQTSRPPSRRLTNPPMSSLNSTSTYCDKLSNIDALQQSTTGHSLYSSALQVGGANSQDCKGAARPAVQMASETGIWKSLTVTITRGTEKKTFVPERVDTNDGKVHHGAFVLGVRKSKECPYHDSKSGFTKEDTDRCLFAHGWRGDTLQSVCTKCTEENLRVCKEKVAHKKFIWELGPYKSASGTIWKSSKDSRQPPSRPGKRP